MERNTLRNRSLGTSLWPYIYIGITRVRASEGSLDWSRVCIFRRQKTDLYHYCQHARVRTHTHTYIRIGVGWNTRELCKYLQETPRLDFSPFEVRYVTRLMTVNWSGKRCVCVCVCGWEGLSKGVVVALYTFAVAAFRYAVECRSVYNFIII